ncbi:ABC transporter ATP-binding protein [Variovorax sp. tm]|uniref:ABC transporter ATP-binding protein n=1 Tax=Variovorax atrisoli TaxID=3394203 RepID=UPI003A80CC94
MSFETASIPRVEGANASASASAAALTGPKLRVSGVSKRYGDVYALKESDLELRQGEFVTLLGPSGSGKTTLLMMIAGLVKPTSGDIWIDGRVATHQQPYERDVGMMFQSYALFPHMTVGENIAFPLKMKGALKERVREAVDEVLEQIKLPSVRNRFPAELSGGQQQRIALARSIVHRPSVVLMDEPLAALDKSLRTHMQMEIRQLQQELGITVLYVTHDQEEAMTMSDRICLMNEARIEQVAAPSELYFSPRTVFAAGFLGESNCLHGIVESVDGTTARVRHGGCLLEGRLMNAAKAGEACRLMVRPEAIRMVAGQRHADQAHGNAIPADVAAHVIGGAVSRTSLRTDSGVLLAATQLTTRSTAAPAGGVTVTFSAQDCLVFGAGA